MKKVAFISQPMRFVSQEEVERRREEAVQYLTEQGYEVVNPFIIPSVSEGCVVNNLGRQVIVKQPDIQGLSMGISDLSGADVAYFMDGWKSQRGCELEHSICRLYGVPCIYEVKSNG